MFARIAVGLVAVAIVGSLAACSDDQPGRDEIIARIKSDPRTQDAPDEVAACIADWYLRYATQDDITAFVNGAPDAKTPEEIAPDDPAEAEMLDCLKRATGKP